VGGEKSQERGEPPRGDHNGIGEFLQLLGEINLLSNTTDVLKRLRGTRGENLYKVVINFQSEEERDLSNQGEKKGEKRVSSPLLCLTPMKGGGLREGKTRDDLRRGQLRPCVVGNEGRGVAKRGGPQQQQWRVRGEPGLGSNSTDRTNKDPPSAKGSSKAMRWNRLEETVKLNSHPRSRGAGASVVLEPVKTGSPVVCSSKRQRVDQRLVRDYNIFGVKEADVAVTLVHVAV